jgi:hypothetical protein
MRGIIYIVNRVSRFATPKISPFIKSPVFGDRYLYLGRDLSMEELREAKKEVFENQRRAPSGFIFSFDIFTEEEVAELKQRLEPAPEPPATEEAPQDADPEPKPASKKAARKKPQS